jgi:ParB family chromosome partitioning protein
MNNGMEKEIFEIYLEDIIPNRFQPRLTFDEKALDELSKSIKEHGIIQPLVVRKVGDKYEIIAGERRYKAAAMAGLQKVPAVVMNLDDNKSAELAVVENLQRQNLNAIEEAESYKKLLDKNYLTQEQLAQRMGKAQATIANKLRLLNLVDEVKDAVLNEKISERHARSLLSLKTKEQQLDVLNKIINNKLTVKQTDELIRSMTGEAPNVVGEEDSSNVGSVYTPPTITPPSPVVNNPVPNINLNEAIIEDVVETIPSPTPNNSFGINNFTDNLDKVKEEKEETMDINQEKPVPNINNLLSVDTPNSQPGSAPTAVPTEQPVPTAPVVETMSQNKFIPNITDEEEIDMNMGDIVSAPKEGITPIDQGNQTIQSVQNTINEPVIGNIPVAPQTTPPTIPVAPVPNEEVPATPSAPLSGGGKDLRAAINNIRDAVKLLEKSGFVVDTEEFDFEHLYQMIIKINK